MKIRNGFVSNSSSSSFILLLKEGEVCPTCGRSSGIMDWLDYGDNGEIYAEGFDEVKAYIEGYYHKYGDIDNMASEDADKIARIEKGKNEHPERKCIYISVNNWDRSTILSMVSSDEVLYESDY